MTTATASTHSTQVDFNTALETIRSQNNKTLIELSTGCDVLVLFLRHSGCTFCREALADLQRQRRQIEAAGTKIAVVHMGQENDATRTFFAHYQLDDVERISDPDRLLYKAFELKRGSVRQLLGPWVWWRGMLAFFSGHGIGILNGDGFQMPGAFIIRDGKIIKAFRHDTAADRPDYSTLACAR